MVSIDCGIGPKGGKAIALALVTNTILTSLDLSSMSLLSNEALLLHIVIMFTGNQLDDQSIEVFVQTLVQNTTLTSLNLVGMKCIS